MRDADDLILRLETDSALRAFFADSERGDPVIVTRAPGRLDVMGGVADYSGALVAAVTIAPAALAAVRLRSDRRLRFWSLGVDQEGFTPQVELSLDDFFRSHDLLGYSAARNRLTSYAEQRWAAYLAGCVYALMAEGIAPSLNRGADVLLESHVPLGAGVSSSAAISVAVMQALNLALDLKLDGAAVARLAQGVENRVVGVPCGPMDQMAIALGVEHALLKLLCQPQEFKGNQPLPEGVRLWGVNSGVRHSVGGVAYANARIGAFMARRLLGADTLAQVPAIDYEQTLRATLPKCLSGSEFLSRYDDHGDAMTQIDPDVEYAIRACGDHGVREAGRTQEFVRLLGQGGASETLAQAGALMFESHDSYTEIGLGCEETDLLAQMARDAGPQAGVYGARITGGGSGGTVAFLTSEAAEGAVREIAARYAEKTGRDAHVFAGGASPGAMAFGSRSVTI